MRPRVSVVVPAYDVAAYLEECLASLARQTLGDLEVVVVDDGSTDATPEIAARFADRDDRFRVVHQANAGLGAARNTGVEHATGELLAFVDSDDVVPRYAYEVLAGALDRTGSDFASGNVRRLTSRGTTQAPFLAEAFERTRLQTHVTRFPPLVLDRTAWNKLFRRAFWEEHSFRFPEGVLYEDIPVTLPAHYLARSVDVIRHPVYLWRRREGGDLSITQRRGETKALRDRVRAVHYVSRFLGEQGMEAAKLEYDKSVLAHDLRYFLDVLDEADDGFRRLFLALANDFLDRTDERVLDQPLALQRLKWHLVRRRALPELLEVLRFEDEDLGEVRPLRRRRQWYGDYPYRRDRRLGIPPGVYRLGDELALATKLNELRWEGERLRIEGYAYIEMLGAARRRSQEVEVTAYPSDAGREPLALRVERVHCPDVTAAADGELASLDWSGFAATLDAAKLARAGRWREGTWEIGIVVRAGGVVRESRRFGPASLRAVPAAQVSAPDGTHLRAALASTGDLTVRVQRRPVLVRSYFLDDGVLQLEGDAGRAGGEDLALHVKRQVGAATLVYPVHVARFPEPTTFLARIPLADLVRKPGDASDAGPEGDAVAWDVYLAGGERRRRLVLHEALSEATWTVAGREVVVRRTRRGDLALVERPPRPVVESARWSPAGALELRGSFRGPAAEYELLVAVRDGDEAYAAPLGHDAEAGRFVAEVRPAAVPSLSGTRPLAEGRWELLVGRGASGREAAAGALVGDALLHELPSSAEVRHKRFHLGVLGYRSALLAAERDLDDDERGASRQRRLRTSFYRRRRRRALADTVLYESFGGREYSDSPRAIHEELVRRGAPCEHLWVVRDAACSVPETAVALRKGSREHYEACARARYVVANDHWPRWFARRRGQTCLQTWHGAPLKRHGRDLADRPQAVREYRRVLRQEPDNWQYVVSPSPAATPIVERAFPVGAEVIEAGLPRVDLLLRDGAAAELKRRLGIPPGARAVLYAPTYRDHLSYRDGYRLAGLLDLAAVRSALPDDVLLFRKHPCIADALPPAAAPLVCDVSTFPDRTALLLVADVLVTDYSSAVFDFASTGRPIVFFTPDLEAYGEIRGFSIDFEAEAPGPLCATSEDVIEALRDTDAVRTRYRDRYDRFVASHCPLADGEAAARVVERVFRW